MRTVRHNISVNINLHVNCVAEFVENFIEMCLSNEGRKTDH